MTKRAKGVGGLLTHLLAAQLEVGLHPTRLESPFPVHHQGQGALFRFPH